VAPSDECLRGKSPPDRMLAIPWRRLLLLSCVTDRCAVERCLDYNKRGCYVMLYRRGPSTSLLVVFLCMFMLVSKQTFVLCISQVNKRKNELCNTGVMCSPAPKSSVTCLNKYNLKSDSVIFVMVTKIQRSCDPLYLLPAFTREHRGYVVTLSNTAGV